MTTSDDIQSWAEKVNSKFTPKMPKNPFTLTVIIPTFNCSERLMYSLESIKNQDFENLEIIVVDASSQDRTIEIARSYFPFVSRLYSVSRFDLFDMINRGISLASGAYVTVLLPGSSYLSSQCYKNIAQVAFENQDPSLIYFGSVQKDQGRAVRLNLYPFERNLLKRGMQIATLPACFFHIELFEKIGKFRPRFPIRGLYDFLCRLSDAPDQKVLFLDRVFVEVEDTSFSYTKIARYVSETWRILHAHFGFTKAFAWSLRLKLLHLLRLWISALMRRRFSL
jgi:glycosyltransferase involved in cell wall biosynthesis